MSSFSAIKESTHQALNHCRSNQQTHFDVIVLGAGSMGSSACYHLARQGVQVLGLEQFEIPNERSSHTGQSRLIRKAYFEHPDYVPLLEKAYTNWKALEAITGEQVYHETGLLYFGQPSHYMMQGLHASADQYHIPLQRISGEELQASYPAFHIPHDYEKLLEPKAGFLSPEKAILLYTQQALQHGAVIKTNTAVTGWHKTKDGVEVNTANGTYFAKKIIITAGPWGGDMIKEIGPSLTVTRQVMAWVTPKHTALFELGKLPCWLIADDALPGAFYGFPILPADRFDGPVGFKLAYHYPGQPCHPDIVDRTTTAEDEAILLEALHKYFPGAYLATQAIKTCLYTNTPDEHFILDFLPRYDKDVIVTAGFSGHGFKFASAIGEILSDLVIKGSTKMPIGFLNAKRFSSSFSLDRKRSNPDSHRD